jgi:hypothetical protein
MPRETSTLDKLVWELGAVSLQANTVLWQGEEARVRHDLLDALDRAGRAVHDCLDDDAGMAIREAWLAIGVAQDMVRHAQNVLAQARAAREQALEMRKRAAAQRDAARRWNRDGVMGILDGPRATDLAWAKGKTGSSDPDNKP